MLTTPFTTTATGGPRGRHRAAPAGDENAPVTITAKGVYAMREPVAPHRLALAIYPTRPDGTCNSEDLIWVNIEPAAVLQLRDALNRHVAGDGTALPDPNDIAGLAIGARS